MRTPADASARREWAYHSFVLVSGLAVVLGTAVALVHDGGLSRDFGLAALIAVPLITVVARYPMVLDRGDGGIEVGFDSSILMFLLCTQRPGEALLAWSAGVVATQLSTDRRASAKVFNIGVGILAGGLAAIVYTVGTGDAVGRPRELLAVALAAAAYFATDYVLSALSVSLTAGTPLSEQLVQPGTLVAMGCFVPFDSLGYLGAVVHRAAPWWTLILLGVPLATLLVAAWAITRGQENARRLTVLFGAAVRAQALSDRDAVEEALLDDARQLVRLKDIWLRRTPPTGTEIGVPVRLGDDAHWLVAKARNRARATAAADEQGLRALVAVASDAVARLELTDEMIHVARHDPLTDLPNRAILVDRATGALARAGVSGRRVTLLFIDLDGFKPVNDRFGHTVGDSVLVDLAARLRACVGEVGVVARLGGDEFAILTEGLDDAEVVALCDRVLRAVADTFVVGGQQMRLGASVGVAHGDRTTTAAGLLRNADLAMYEAKARGKGRWVGYEPTMGRARLERLELVDDLRQAVAAREIEVVYQPVVDAGSGRIVGAEALARWRRGGEPVSPEVFISLAEETGLILELGDAVLAEVVTDASALRVAVAQGPFALSVNISAAQLRAPAFVGSVERTVAALDGVTLVLEITERQGVDLTGEVLEAMRRISEMGVWFAIDDFGVGFSSISYLRDLPARIIKADAALSADIDSDERARTLLRSVVVMGRELGYHIVVEGIEREEQLAVVRADAPESLVQGYLLHRPMPLSQLVEVLTGVHNAIRR